MNSNIFRSKKTSKYIKNAFLACSLGFPFFNANSDVTKDEKNNALKLKKGPFNFSLENTYEVGAGTADYIDKKSEALPFKMKVSFISTLGLNFNREGENKGYKMFNIKLDASLINDNTIIGDIIKYKGKFGKFIADNYFWLNSAEISYMFLDLNDKHEMTLKGAYGSSAYVINENSRFFGPFLTYKYKNQNKESQLENFAITLGFEFGTEGGTMIKQLLDAINDKDVSNYSFVGPTFFKASNIGFPGFNLVLPNICLSADIVSKLAELSLKFNINPFPLATYQRDYKSFMKWGVILDAKVKTTNEFAKEDTTVTLAFGRDELLSNTYIDNYIAGFDDVKKAKWEGFTNNDGTPVSNGEFFIMTRPLIFVENLKTKLHFAHLIKEKANFIKDLVLGLEVNSEEILSLALFIGNNHDITNVQFDKKHAITFKVSLNPSLEFESNIDDPKLKFLAGFTISPLNLNFKITPVMKCLPLDAPAANEDIGGADIRFNDPKLSLGLTVLGLTWKSSKLGLTVDGHIGKLDFTLKGQGGVNWHDLLSVSAKFDLFEFLNNRNKESI